MAARGPTRQQHVTMAVHTIALPSGVVIRAWRTADFPAIQALSRAEGWPTPDERPDEALAAWRASWPALVALHNRTLIGFLRALTDGVVTCFVPELLVAPAWQGRGIGRALLLCCHLIVPRTRIELLATEASAPYYAHVGFRPMYGYRKGSWEWGDTSSEEPGGGSR